LKKWRVFNWRDIVPVPVIGIDEVGRGCLAGPVVAAACILQSEKHVRLLKDSKLVSAPRREEIYEKIITVHRFGVGFASAQEIDEINILQASFLAMRRALDALGVTSGHVLVDGHMRIPKLVETFSQTPLIKGDLRCKPISAASIIAKVTRDRWMRKLAKEFPDYGFEVHKGYGTAYHRDMLLEVGPCREHRRSFSGVAFDEGLLLRIESGEMALPEQMVD
jgi:ribonuclease HII